MGFVERSIRRLGAVVLCAFAGLTGCGLDPVPWPPANANVERASHPSDETFRRKGWRDAVRFEGSETVRAFSLGPVGNAAALRLGLLREGRQHGMLTARVYVDNKVVKELPLLSRTSWAEYLVDLGPTAPEAECMVTFESPDAFWVAPLELVPAQSSKPNVLIVVLDTLRADHCSLYGYPRKTTPSLDAFAKEAVVFDNMLATSSWTRPTIASLMTGAYPGRHGARTYTDVVRSDLPRIAAILNDNQYETYAFARNANVHPYWGLGNEFFSYAFFGVGTSDDHVMQTLRHTLPKLKGSTWFAYIHLLDPHGPYTPREIRYGPHKGTDPAAYQEQFVGRMFSGDGRYMTFAQEGIGVSRDRFIELQQEHGPDAAEPDPLPGLVRESIDLYDSEIYEADARFNEILNLLKDTGQFDDTLIVFLSDHGEEFFEHEGWTHGKTVYEEGVHVPLVIRMPGGEYAGDRVSSLVETVDLPSTILSFLGLDVPETMQGRNLLPMIAGQEDPEHVGFASLFNEQGSITELSAAKWRHWKLIVDHVRKADAFYDLSVDPGELNPSAMPPENGPAMRDRVSALRFRMADGLHLVFTSPIEAGEGLESDDKPDIYEGEITVPGMGEVALQYPDQLYTLERAGDTVTFRIEMKRGDVILPAHRLTHAQLVIEAPFDGTMSLSVRKNGEPIQSMLVPAQGEPNALLLSESQTPFTALLAPVALASAAVTPADGNLYTWFVPETASIPAEQMDDGMRESLEAMGYL